AAPRRPPHGSPARPATCRPAGRTSRGAPASRRPRPGSSSGCASTGSNRELYYNGHPKSMGKRELLLVAGFALVGAVIYHATMPASPGGGASFGEWLGRVRSHIQNEWKERRYERKAEAPVPATVKTVAIEIDRATVTIVGEPRDPAAV